MCRRNSIFSKMANFYLEVVREKGVTGVWEFASVQKQLKEMEQLKEAADDSRA